MNRKLKILYVTRALHAPVHGGCMIRTANIYRQLKQDAEITMLAVSGNFVPSAVDYCESEFQPFYKVDIKPYTEYSPFWGNLLKKWYMHWPGNMGVQAMASDQLLFQRLLDEHDVVWFHTLQAAHPFKFDRLPFSVMDLDDLNHLKFQQRAQIEKNRRFQLSMKVQAHKWKRQEFSAINGYDRVIVCSHHDKEYLGGNRRIEVIPNGYVRPTEKPQWQVSSPDRIGFIGLMSYDPNRDGLIWFRDHVWPLIRKRNPKMKLRIIGTLPPPKQIVEAEGFEYLGFLKETQGEMKTWSSLIVPITYGGGTRIKILDAFSKMCPVVATAIGAHGICAEHNKNILLADDPSEFSQHCLNLSEDPRTAQSLAEAGWELFTKYYSWDVIGEKIRAVVKDVL